uniref:Tetratricopeptide repeat protein n=1 Tax=candidate division WOR-3 bacterium TaxID=2052148 RepID=A0A7C4CDS7_UNCW3
MRNKQSRPPKNSRALPWPLPAVVLVGLVVRVGHVLQMRGTDPMFFAPQLDALYHHQWAMAVAAGIEFVHDAYFRAPLYPLLLGLMYKLFGVGMLVPRLVQAGIGAAGCGLLFLIGRRLLDERSGLLAGLAMAVYPLLVYYDGELLLEGLLVVFVLAGFVLLLRSRELDRHWILPGLAFGLAAITRPNVLAFLSVMPVWFGLEFRRGWWRRLLLFVLGVMVPIAPVTIRNYVVSRRFVPIAWQGGINFYIGNNPEADALTAIAPGSRGSWTGAYYDAKRRAEQALGRELKGAEIDRFWMGKGLEFWRREPGRALGLLLRKAFLWISGYEVSSERDIYFARRYFFLGALVTNLNWLKLPWGLLLPLALAGAWFERKRGRRFLPVYLFLVAHSLSFVLFLVGTRFRLPLVPFLLLLAVAGARQFLRQRGRELRVGAGIAVAAFFAFNLNWVRLPAVRQITSYEAAATGYLETGRPDRALTELRQGLAQDSTGSALVLESAILAAMGRLAESELAARGAVRLEPEAPESWGALGRVLAGKGALDSAGACFEQALQLDPYSVAGWTSLGNVALERGDFAGARAHYERALQIEPASAAALFHLGLAEFYSGNRARAHELWRRTLKLDPGYSRAKLALEQLR